ncbi:YqkE family protein [Viridibacillus sp. YIM B01967]|uniref:YqkE family protein n=1 Tax=Viridibacillus soli TaxID=2798301 RepID=A0ABS1H4E0_9BACL|nr:YqkE family protein [Viridibacillus soli]MBK3494287.1 YqkE family protein [Viridibacillus soli]
MAKKKKQKRQQPSQQPSKDEALTLKDQLNGDVLEKLKLAKKELVVKEQAAQEEREAKLVFERKQREKNKSFEELLNEYGDKGSKFNG